MNRNYNKSDKQYGRKLRISFCIFFFYIAVALVQLGNDYRQQKIELIQICVDIAQTIHSDVSYKNVPALKNYFQGISEAAELNTLSNAPRIAHWQISSAQEIITDNSIHSYSFIRSLFENVTNCPVKNIKSPSNLSTYFTLTLSSLFYLNIFELFWVLISSLILTIIPLLVYLSINKNRELEKEQVINFITEINQKAERNLTTEYSNSNSISSVLNSEAQPILSFIDKTAELSDRYDSQYVNTLEKNFIDLEERNAHLAIQNKDLNNQTTLKSSFFANLSHDFRTPLYTIDGYSRLLLSTPLDRKQLSHVNAIQIANANLLELVSNFLSLSRLEAGKIDLDYNDVDIRKMIQEITMGLSFLVIEHRNHFFIDISEKLPQTIKIDAIKFRQILANLISNAVKYTHNGILYIHIACREIDSKTISISISITDTGKGISEQDIETIFDPYTRLDRDTTDVHGTGLGLGICKELCEIIGAKLSVKSNIDKGSSFTVDLTSQTGTQKANEIRTPALIKYKVVVYNSISDMDIYIPEWLKPVSHKVTLNSWHSLLNNKNILQHDSDAKILILLDYEHIKSLAIWAKNLYTIAKNVFIYAPLDYLSKSDLKLIEPFTILNNNISNIELGQTFSNNKALSTLSTSKTTTEDTLKGYVLLLAEDNDLNRKIIEERLNSFGAKVISCPDGSAALELYKARKYHAILMDAHMPKLSGIELTKVIRNEFKDTKTPIIGITASTSTVEYQHFIQAGMSDCLIKPLNDQLLVETIKKYALNDIQGEPHAEPVEPITPEVITGQTIQERIDELSRNSIREHLNKLKEIFNIHDLTDMQQSLFHEVHNLNGTISMTSFKKLQKKINEIETLINPVLWSADNLSINTITAQVQQAKNELLEIWPKLEKKALVVEEKI